MAYRSLLRNIPALVYSSNPAAPSSCRLIIKYSETHKQASIILYFLAHIHGFEAEQSFVLTYDANNLVPGTSFLRPTTEHLSRAQRSQIARNDTPSCNTLHLTLRQPCTVSCPPSTSGIAPKPGHELHLHQLREHARALEICIVFDHNYLHVDCYAAFHRLVSRPENLVGIPVDKYQGTSSRQADWTIFIPIEDAAREAPPLYTDVGAKRHRQAPSSSSPERSPTKRRFITPRIEAADAASWNPLLGSPTEKATTTTVSPSPPRPSSPYNAPDLHDVVGNAVETMVPQVLRKILPNMLSDLFTIPTSPKPDNEAANSIGARITARLAADAEPFLTKMVKKIEQDNIDHDLDLRRYTDAQLFEEIEDHKLDLNSAKEEALAEIRLECEKLTQELVDVANAKVKKLSEDVQGLVNETFVDVYDKLNELVEKKKPSLQKHVRKILKQEKERFAAENYNSRGRRAVSLPL
ncbi:hypothetical protein BU23DRAFT_301028 [Bimuria novae-zelandiae CBS 107.79]|uniref:Uncharacterized protein n=1 Tax=Bimuria novae-zelandiae CBS 107.79 TaxID=1447943 RepID=A0A6A5UWD9_9PLEO|nr:hypothetical protein BU23DRAFT_301028 [Bimuria novae-zelandiae CBS 107.79]